MRTLIAILVLFFSTSTFVNPAKSLEYTVLTDAEVEYLLQTYADIKTTERYAHLHQDPINKAIDDVSYKIKKVMEL